MLSGELNMIESVLVHGLDTVWVLLAAILVFFMFGYAIMFGPGNAFIGLNGWFLMGAESGTDIPLFAFWPFQAAFCGAAATIVAGGMAERMRFPTYLIYSFIISAIIYPLIGHWIWGGGWLAALNFTDFAGSTVVHAVGGFASLIGTIMLKPRIGKFSPSGRPNAIAGHNIPLASLGVFILWFGWFGFNAGSTLGVGDGTLIARIAINTNLAASLVAIGGIIVVLGVVLLDRLRIDDPVGIFGKQRGLDIGEHGMESYSGFQIFATE